MGSADERGQPFRVAVREFCRLLGGDHGFQQVLVRELRGCFDVLHVSQITTDCEIASNRDPSQDLRMSLISRANSPLRWGRGWTRHAIP